MCFRFLGFLFRWDGWDMLGLVGKCLKVLFNRVCGKKTSHQSAENLLRINAVMVSENRNPTRKNTVYLKYDL